MPYHFNLRRPFLFFFTVMMSICSFTCNFKAEQSVKDQFASIEPLGKILIHVLLWGCDQYTKHMEILHIHYRCNPVIHQYLGKFNIRCITIVKWSLLLKRHGSSSKSVRWWEDVFLMMVEWADTNVLIRCLSPVVIAADLFALSLLLLQYPSPL